MNSFDGSLIENIGRFKEFLRKYNEEIERKKKSAKIDSLKIYRMEVAGKWYLKALNGKRVVGVDGSQISPLRELGIPIGVIQVAKVWVIHGRGEFERRYKTTFVRLEDNLDFMRFRLELEMLEEEMDGKSWLFFDGSLVPHVTDPAQRERYEREIARVLKLSEKTETPILGYIDKSFSKDVAKKFGLEIYDAFLLSDVMDVFSYTQPFEHSLPFGEICYAYLMVNPSMPVRIEYPSWMIEMHDEIVRIVFAECLLGKTRGYPYILERAHRYSCIDAKARASFMKAVRSHGVSFKWISKIR